MEFPLKPDFFPPVRLTAEDRQRYVATAEYSVHVLRKLVADDKWKRISETKGVTVGKVHCIEEQGHAARACLIVCASVTATGTVSEVLEAIASPVTDDYRRAMHFLHADRFVDGVCLHTLSNRNAQAFTTIKWAAFKDGLPSSSASIKPQHFIGTDYCFLEHSGIHPTESFGFCIQESISRQTEVPSMPGFGLARGELHRTGILVLPTDRKDTVQLASILQMDTATALSKSALEKIMVRRVTAIARLPLLLDRRRLSRLRFVPRDNWVHDSERKACAVCTKTFGLRRKHHCRHCGEVVCATCAPPRDVDVSAYGVASLRICTACVVLARQQGKQQSDVLVFHVAPSPSPSQARSSQENETSDAVDDTAGLPMRRASSSADSNFSISSDEGAGMDEGGGGYDQYDDGYDREDSQVVSIGPGSPDGGLSVRYSGYSEASSGLSFSDLNSLADDALRVTSVTTNNDKPVARHHSPPPYNSVGSENRPPNYTQRESLDEWFALRKPQPPVKYHDEAWSTPSRPSRERNYSHASNASETKRGSSCSSSHSSASSANSLMDMLASIHEMKATLAPAVAKPQRHEPMYMERLSEMQLRKPELPTPQQQPTPVRQSDLAASRGGTSSRASTVDIDLLDSDSFSLLCPETLQRQLLQQRVSTQDAGERRSARASNLSTSTVLEDVDDLDSMRQSELAALRTQVEGLHKSLEDATNKLNYFTARSMVRDHVDTLEREVSSERRHHHHTGPADPVARERKDQYHALIDELHEIMGLPALRTRPRSEELLHA